MKNKIKYGLKNVYYAKITDTAGVITYGTPTAIKGAVNIALSGLSNAIDIAADDNEVYATMSENKGYDGDIEFQIFPDSAKVDILGATLNTDNVLVESKTDKPDPVALMFEFQGDSKAVRHVLYNCLISKPNIESGTKGENIENKTDTLAVKCRPAIDTGLIKGKTSEETTALVYDGWFTDVYIETVGGE